MRNGCRIDDPPLDRFANFVCETFRFGPRLAVNGEYRTAATGGEIDFVPIDDNENTIALFCSRRINNERASEQGFLTLAFFWAVEVSAGSGRPVHVSTDLTGVELHFTG